MNLDIQEVEVEGRKGTMSNMPNGLKKIVFEDGDMIMMQMSDDPIVKGGPGSGRHKESEPIKLSSRARSELIAAEADTVDESSKDAKKDLAEQLRSGSSITGAAADYLRSQLAYHIDSLRDRVENGDKTARATLRDFIAMRDGVQKSVLELTSSGTLALSKASIDAAAHEAATSPKNDLDEPTDEQKEAGNYQKGHINVGGIDIAIENPAGSKRKPEWPTLESHYGYINLTQGADGEHIDCFVRPGTDENYNGPVFIIDQVDQDGTFDEHKCLVGWYSKQAAVDAYLVNYTPGWRVGNVTKLDWKVFREWVDEKVHTVPLKN